MISPHVVVIPYPAQGHAIPLMELSQCLVKQGIRITFMYTECNANLVINCANDQIRLLLIPDGLSMEDRKRAGKTSEAVMRIMPRKFEELIEQIKGVDGDEITCVLADQSLGWAMEISHKKGIRRAAFCPAAAALLVLGFSIPKLIHDGIIDNEGTPREEQTIKLSPTMPPMSTTNFVWANIGNLTAQKNIFQLMLKNNMSMKLADWLLCNSTYDIEPAAFTLAPNILPIGPLLARNRLGEPAENLSSEASDCLKWLDQQPPCSVIYVAFGSFTDFDPIQFQELAWGLQLSGRPFLWVVRPDISTDTKINAFLQEFKKKLDNRGQIVDWAPQQKILSHLSVACFLSHCGWNSTIEGISCGIPFLCWPYFADQFLNQSYICDIWEVGLGLTRTAEKGIITREEIKNKVDHLLASDKFKEKALTLKEIVMASGRKGGTSAENFKNFVQWIKTVKISSCISLQMSS